MACYWFVLYIQRFMGYNDASQDRLVQHLHIYIYTEYMYIHIVNSSWHVRAHACIVLYMHSTYIFIWFHAKSSIIDLLSGAKKFIKADWSELLCVMLQ